MHLDVSSDTFEVSKLEPLKVFPRVVGMRYQYNGSLVVYACPKKLKGVNDNLTHGYTNPVSSTELNNTMNSTHDSHSLHLTTMLNFKQP